MKRKCLCALAALWLWMATASAQKAVQQIPEEKVIVTASAYPVAFETLARTVAVLTRSDLDRLPVRSIAEALAYMSSVEVRSRAPMGLQADFSVRGSAYSQVLILVDGVRINDSQTAHHNADIPVQLQDVERIEVLYGPGSALYGADAFGGIINIVTRRKSSVLQASVAAGQFGLIEGAFQTGFGIPGLEQSVSATGSRSSGFMYDRDFRNIAVSSRTAIGGRSSLFFSHVNREFGANGFYGPAPSREWTNQTLVSFQQRLGGKPDSRPLLQSYYRTHGDRFLYDLRTPGLYENRHRTHAAGVRLKSQWSRGEAVSVSYGGEGGGDAISSSNLGDHAYARVSGFGEMQYRPVEQVILYPAVRYDYYSNFGSALSPSLSGSWWFHSRLRLRSSIAHAFRIPTFTELYYRDPNNQADPEIAPEKSWSAEAGLDFLPARNWLGSLVYFSRRERDVIDWIRASPQEKWRTANIRRMDTKGFEVGIERSFKEDSRLALHYTRLDRNAGAVDYLSKYVLDYVRDSFAASASVSLPLAMSYSQVVRYRRRHDGRNEWLLDGRLEKRLYRFSAAMEFSNLLNCRYQEVAGVDMPGRWFIGSLQFDLSRPVR